MIFLELFYVFSKIGIFNFGGGYAMLSLIQDEVVNKHHWMTINTPGPIGINCATYTGYTAVVHAGYPTWAAVLGAVLASLSVIWLPFILMVTISKYLIKHHDSKTVTSIFGALRPVIVGLIAAAALMLMSKENFGSPSESPFVFVLSIIIFLMAFVGTRLYKVHPIIMILMCGLAGLLIY